MSVVKSDLIKQLSKNYPNFLKKDLLKLLDITIHEIQDALKRGERVELRDILIIGAKNQKSRTAINPKTLEKIKVPEKKNIYFKVSKSWNKKINEKI